MEIDDARNRQKGILQRVHPSPAQNAAALFVGAGLSVGAGFVDWKKLLKEIAEDLGLDVDRESDLIALAQFHVNHRKGRDRINQLIIDHFIENVALTPSHRLVSLLPIQTVWTTNYDDLLETAFEEANKRVDVKRRPSDFSTTRRNSDVTIYKMHGDKTAPAEAVLTKEDYESYHKTRELFTIALKGDLSRKTFLFLGFSFTDPNVGYILGRVKQLLEDNARQHYCLIKQPKAGECGDDSYSCTRFTHWLADLRRYKIIPVLVNSYAEIPEILAELNRRCHLRDVFLSGSAHDFSPLGPDKFRELCRLLGAELITKGFNIISGFGLGVGDMVIVGAMQTLRRNDDERLQLWPFPQTVPAGTDRATLWREYRERMLSNAGVCIVLAGNKLVDGHVVPADGVRQELEIARTQGKLIIPIGATGHVARGIWEQVQANPGNYYGTAMVADEIAVLGNEAATPKELVTAAIGIMKAMDK